MIALLLVASLLCGIANSLDQIGQLGTITCPPINIDALISWGCTSSRQCVSAAGVQGICLCPLAFDEVTGEEAEGGAVEPVEALTGEEPVEPGQPAEPVSEQAPSAAPPPPQPAPSPPTESVQPMVKPQVPTN